MKHYQLVFLSIWLFSKSRIGAVVARCWYHCCCCNSCWYCFVIVVVKPWFSNCSSFFSHCFMQQPTGETMSSQVHLISSLLEFLLFVWLIILLLTFLLSSSFFVPWFQMYLRAHLLLLPALHCSCLCLILNKKHLLDYFCKNLQVPTANVNFYFSTLLDSYLWCIREYFFSILYSIQVLFYAIGCVINFSIHGQFLSLHNFFDLVSAIFYSFCWPIAFSTIHHIFIFYFSLKVSL